MDDFLEQMFPFASWSEMGSVSRAPWDYNSGGSANAMSMEIDSSLPVPQRLSLLPPVRVGGSTESQASSFQTRQVHNNISHPQADGAVHYASEESSITSRLQQLQILRTAALDSGASSSVGHPHINGKSPGAQEAVHSPVQNTSEGVATTGSVAPQVNAGKSLLANALPSQMVAAGTGSYRALGMTRSPSVGNEGFGSQQSPPDSQLSSTVAPTWRQSFGGGVSPLPVVGGQVKAEFPAEATSNDAHLLGKMSRDDDEARHGPQESFFNNFPGELGRLQPRTAGQQSHQQMQVGQGAPIQQYGHAQPQGAAAVIAGTRTRVRARRGQATDPHSIAERLRRERIAERMKALQELVPNANKTDKASMLDEVIEYVKFLQLQVKVLSMSRLGGAGAVAPLVTDLLAEGHNIFGATALGHGAGVSCPPQNGSAVTEHQVAQLLEKDMGSAMQFLQSKGLCLMPISLATVISTTNHRTPTGILSGLQGLTVADRPQDVLSSTTAASSISTEVSGAIVSPANVEGNGVSHAAATED